MVETGRAAAFVMDDILLHSLIATSQASHDYLISDEALSAEPYGIMLRKGDEAFKNIVNTTMIKLYRSGEIYRIYDKWFRSAIPPRGINLNIPMSEALKRALASPTDSPDPADYR